LVSFNIDHSCVSFDNEVFDVDIEVVFDSENFLSKLSFNIEVKEVKKFDIGVARIQMYDT
jgi:hypothetical protein